MTNVKRPTAVITGGGKGIGQAVAEVLHACGYDVAIADYDFSAADAVAKQLSPDRSTARAYALDVRCTKNITEVFQSIEAELGFPSALVNNAGVYPNQAALDMSEALWDKVLDTNLKGSFFCSQALARSVKEHGIDGAIVNVASTAAFSARLGASAYSASKAAQVMMTKSLAQEFAPQRIRVNAVAPGLVEVKGGAVSSAYSKQFLALVPCNRIGKPRDIANVVAFLLSRDAEYVNGECIVVDGGFLAGRALQPSSISSP